MIGKFPLGGDVGLRSVPSVRVRWEVRRGVEHGVAGGREAAEEEVEWWWVELTPTPGIRGVWKGRNVEYECT